MATSAQVAIILAQAGVDVDAAACVDQLRLDVPNTVVIQQQVGESVSALGQRVRGRIAQLANQNFRLHSATFLAQRGFGLGDVLATADLLRVLISSMLALGAGQVCLQPETYDPHAHVALRALADALSDQVRGTGIEIVSRAGSRPSVRPPMASEVPPALSEAAVA
ncbi:MAG: hypothetical protein QM778_03940 [Myxococcales bacterium]